MTQTVLILGRTGRFGRNASDAFAAAGWTVRGFDRARDDLMQAARGVDVIVNGWNPPYPQWARVLPDLHARVRAAAKASDATVILPGNVYVFGPHTPIPWGAGSPHAATNPLGRLRIEMERAYEGEGVRTILLRAGDFLDTRTSGNWFDQIMITRLKKGRFTYPGNPDIPHAWAYLPDLTRAAEALARMRESLPRFADIPFLGYTLTGHKIAGMLSQITGQRVRLRRMNWLPLQVARPVWPLGRCLLEMRYLWDTPHSLDGTRFEGILPGFQRTEAEVALRTAIGKS
ncbi:epimerase [Aestuariivita sp.]|jgi:nucleoside-diphosphate-sugar epimerase|uniref:epimerase n=1 Tax=Aestuariivita sp. TaxID=1872407 RepID=UPI00216E23D3|nr:epimerase [Aestuariivita sp.]MCE8006298.1 epimerase [Aestuariivita sp.]